MELNLPVVGFGGYHEIPWKSVLLQLLLTLVGIGRQLLCRLVCISRVPHADVLGFVLGLMCGACHPCGHWGVVSSVSGPFVLIPAPQSRAAAWKSVEGKTQRNFRELQPRGMGRWCWLGEVQEVPWTCWSRAGEGTWILPASRGLAGAEGRSSAVCPSWLSVLSGCCVPWQPC